MIKQTRERFLLLLAGSGFSANELEQVLDWLRSASPSLLAALVKDIRDRVTLSDIEMEEPLSGAAGRRRGQHSDVARNIDQLLRVEAGLSTREAVDKLVKELSQKALIRQVDVPPYRKTSFVEWLERLLTLVPSSQVLHVATILRNEAVHSPRNVWPLRDGGGNR